ncbi:MAG: 16S rRNA (uracil(1498)-N(3))-methyltransferase [Bacteroidetes bacterium 4572_77]|nr:MAG: 16S rRNA (uracil(1498)-N(3))-methyltransferase [Bacteroidetes bacterium 4572_77]
MQLFYTPNIVGNTHQLNQEESKHAIKVLRLSLGSIVWLTNGKGRWMKGEIEDDHAKRCRISIIESQENYQKKPYELTMAVAPTKNISRFEWFLEKATEIGIDTIYPMLSEHSERKVIKRERLEKVITAAMKQSLKAWHPELTELDTFKHLIEKDFDGQKFIAYCEAPKSEKMEKYLSPGHSAFILIGPEGGFSPKEISLAQEQGFRPINISASRLRTETAAIVACHSVAFINN